MDAVSAMYSSSILLRSGGYFLRLVLGVRILAESAIFLPSPAADTEVELCRALLQLGERGGGANVVRDREEFLQVADRRK
jgi:hypothetical protein